MTRNRWIVKHLSFTARVFGKNSPEKIILSGENSLFFPFFPAYAGDSLSAIGEVNR